MNNLLKNSTFKCLGFLLLGLLLLITKFAQASDGKQLFVPIATDIVIFVPLMPAPATVTTSVVSQTVGGSIYTISWSGVANAAYYQILMTDDKGEKTYFETTNLTYKLAGLPVGNTRVEILACNSQNQCGAGALVGTYNVTEKVTYAHTDILGSPILEMDQAGSIVQEFHYKPFGDTKETKKETVGYTGHLEDTDLNLTYMQARYYDPVIGRFYGNDPVGFVSSNPMSFNRYLYVNNNPYRYTDPTGKYMCGGSAEQCGRIEAGVQKIRDASTSKDITNIRQQQLTKIVSILGKAGEKNGVFITVGATKSGGIAEFDGKGGDASNSRAKITVDLAQIKNPIQSGGAIAHEVKHAQNYEQKKGGSETRQEAFKDEQSAYRVTSDVYQGNGVPGSYTQGAIDRGAEESTNNWCKRSKAPGC